MARAVFLDRDGVLVHAPTREGKPYAITIGGTVDILDGVPEACAALAGDGYLLIMVTNQPDVARGLTPLSFVERTNREIAARLCLDAVRVCPHDDGDGCVCRKPKPGMITTAAAEFGIDLEASVMVGDRWRDVEAGRRAGCRTVLIDRGYAESMPNPPDHLARSLLEAVGWIGAQFRNP